MIENTTYLELLDNLHDGVYYVDKERKITFWNKAAEKISGYKSSEILGKHCGDNILCHIDAAGTELCRTGCPLHQTLQDGEKREASLFLHHKDGHRVPVHVRIAPVKNDQGEIIGGVEIFSDNTRNLEVLHQLELMRQENNLDPLLQIGNRRQAEKIFEGCLYELKAYNVPFCVILVDLDELKLVNDKYGHNIGDQVLKMTARSLGSVLRDMDSIVRWGGDEIVLFLPHITEPELAEVAERIRIFIKNSFIMLEDEKLLVAASLGATTGRVEDTLEVIINRADELMYLSKKAGGNRISIG